jgi:rubrerythrin
MCGRLDQYAQDAERENDEDLARLFRQMQEHSRRGGEECKRLLKQRLEAEEA